VSRSEVFWFDDSADGGGCSVPASWRLLYKDGDQWKPVEGLGPYGVAKGSYNQVDFKPVTTTGLRMEIAIRSDSSTGIQKWHVE